MHNQEPQKWRDTIDPLALPLNKLKITEILGYPHAANDVFMVKALCDGQGGCYYLKYARHADANLKNEVQILSQIHSPLLPRLIEYDDQSYRWVVTKHISGQRLSVILSAAKNMSALAYLHEYGQTLAQLHGLAGTFPAAPHRIFHDMPEDRYFAQHNLEHVGDWLRQNTPAQRNLCFVHGDFHYANILWQDGHISGILDFELSGMGNREFDIAWALILRPGQRFMKTETEREEFLSGYTSLSPCDDRLVRYYMVLIYTRFIKFGDEDYADFVRQWMTCAIKE